VVVNHLLSQKVGDAPDPKQWPAVARTRLDLLTARQLLGLYASLLSSGRRDGKEGGLSRRSVRFLASVIGKALKDAARKGLVRTNVALNADPPSEKASEGPETKVWTPAEAGRFLASVAEDPDALLWRFYLATGCRRGEALGLRWSDVDLDAGRVSITQQYTIVGAVPTMLPVKSDRSRRVVDLDPLTVDLLRRHRVEQAEHRLAGGAGYDIENLGLVFAKADGSPHHPKRVSARFERRVGRAGVPELRSTTCATRRHRSCSPPASSPASSRNGWATRRSRSPSPATRRSSPAHRPKRPPATPGCSMAERTPVRCGPIGGTMDSVTIGEELLEERRRRRRSGDPRITPEGREVLLRLTTGDLMDEFQAALDADLEADPFLGGHDADLDD
jgi:integrase